MSIVEQEGSSSLDFAQRQRPKGGALGIYAKSHSASPNQDKTQAGRALRWKRKAAVNKLLKNSRTSKCHRWSVPSQSIKAMRSEEFSRAFYAGLQVCASVWACPICKAKIAERRRAELATAMALAKAQGYYIYLLTQTIPHGPTDDLKVLISGIKAAQKHFTSSRRGVAWRKAIGAVGTVRSFEVTFGDNGPHPHFHTLLILKYELSEDELQAVGSALWQQSAKVAGLPAPHPVYGFDVQNGTKAAHYIAKWGMADEMTRAGSKAAKGKGHTPDQLLDLYMEGDKQAGAIFAAYAKAFKGQRALVWSRGLKKMLAVKDISDEELAVMPEDETAAIFAEIDAENWLFINRHNLQSWLLDLIENDPEEAHRWLRKDKLL